MLNSQALEVGIGLVLVFLLFSLILTAVRETIEAYFKTRAVDLERAIAELLHDRAGAVGGLRRKFYEHPFIAAFYSGNYEATVFDSTTGKPQTSSSGFWSALAWVFPIRVAGSRRKPTYIPKRQFAQALLDLARNGELGGAAAKAILALRGTAVPVAEADLLNAAEAARHRAAEAAEAALKSLVAKTVGDLTGKQAEELRSEIGDWYDGAMDRASGWFKRRTQAILFVLGLILALALNINAVSIGQALSQNADLRVAVAGLAEQTVDDYRERLEAEQAEAEAAAAEDDAADGEATEGEAEGDGAVENAFESEAADAEAADVTEPPDGEGDDGAAADPADPETTVADPPVEPEGAAAAGDDGDAADAPVEQAAEQAAADAAAAKALADEARRLADRELARDLHGDLLAIGLPIGWSGAGAVDFGGFDQPLDWVLWGAGFLVTAFAATLGAPFWFDVLNKFMVVRSTVKPKEKSGEEGSEDRPVRGPAGGPVPGSTSPTTDTAAGAEVSPVG